MGKLIFIIEAHVQILRSGFTLLYIIIYTIYAIHFFMFIFSNINSFGVTSAKYKDTNSQCYYRNNLTTYLADKYRYYSLFKHLTSRLEIF